MEWRIFHKAVTASTNLDAAGGQPGDAFTAGFQTAGRGRLDHRWFSEPGHSLLMSVILDVEGVAPEHVSTLTLAIGLAVLEGLSAFLPESTEPLALKWPNDIYWQGRKLAGILCQLSDRKVTAGIGVNVKRQRFDEALAPTALSLEEIIGTIPIGGIERVRDAVLASIDLVFGEWRCGGLSSLHSRIAAVDWLKGRTVAVRQTDTDSSPIIGICGGIAEDGALLVGSGRIYAGEAHLENWRVTS